MWLVPGFDLPLFWTDGYTVVSSLGLSGDQDPCRYHSTWRSGRQWKLAGNHLCLFACLFVCLFVVQLHTQLPPERMQSIEGKSKDVAE